MYQRGTERHEVLEPGARQDHVPGSLGARRCLQVLSRPWRRH